MADLPVPASFAFSGGVTTSGQTQPVDLEPVPRNVTAVCNASSVSAGGSVQVTLQMCNGNEMTFASSWINVVTLGVQSAAGVQQASAAVPASATNKARLVWATTGNGAAITAAAIAAG